MMMRSVVLMLVWWFLCGICLGKFLVEKNILKVTSPESLKGKNECAIGNFGIPRYGGTMAGTVVYPRDNSDACKAIKKVKEIMEKKPGGLPIFLLVDRGECNFTMKAWNSQNAGAAAILVVDYKTEPLITMDQPDEASENDDYIDKITIPSVLISKSLGEKMKKALSDEEIVSVVLDWTDALPNPDERVEYEFWMSSDTTCGPKCDSQMNFLKDFKGSAQILEKTGYTSFTPHYITLYCSGSKTSNPCATQCINKGRYCAPDTVDEYLGAEVVLENLRQACIFRVTNESGKPWLWWDYVTDFTRRCSMQEGKFSKACAGQVIDSLGMAKDKIEKCMGDPNVDEENPILQAEQGSQIGKGPRGDITMLPTLLINGVQYRGKLDRVAVLKAICAGFRETTEPSICLRADMETNECLDKNGGCWEDKANNITACRDTFRGRVCECPVVQGVQFLGDGYTECKPSKSSRCRINNGGCWHESRDGKSYSACPEDGSEGCKCPPGFKMNAENSCEDVDECEQKLACQCPECKCNDTWGGYECSCSQGLLYIKDQDTCISRKSVTKSNAGLVWLLVLGLAALVAGGYLLYKYRIRRYMDSEIRGIMAQYMPLDGHAEPLIHSSGDI
ncbi:hypothetical protein MLD38_032597 [Melastoma candidum]|uniref:Uncharacterized protein n=1 Tax=Melastoma candidum TaxID=119954 RepID=A0ACB9M3W7_9MYRT|nr:hypothetical protein MLD38_032597 [Melastoma candidum]